MKSLGIHLRVRADLEWATRGYRNGDERQVLDLLGSIWPPSHSSKYWSWLHRENPGGHSIIRIVDCEHEIVAYAAGVPVVMKMGEEYVGLLGMHVVTRPDHRGKGMARRLVGEVIAGAAARGLAVDYGVADAQAMRRAGMPASPTRTRRMKDFLLVLNLRRILNRKDLGLIPKLGAVVLRAAHRTKMLQPPDGVRIEQISEFDESFDELWNGISSSLGKRVVIKRSRAYLRWRYSLHPEHKYLTWVAKESDVLLGFVIASHFHAEDSHRGVVADIFGFDHRRDAMVALVSSVVRYFKSQDAELLRCQLSDGHPCTRVLVDAGFVVLPSRHWLSLGVISPAVGVDQAWLLRRENHMITWGDLMV